MSKTMRAQRLNTKTKEFSVQDVPIPTPGRGQALVKIAFCGICHSDLSLIDGVVKSSLDEITQGHEASGTVVEIGEGVRKVKVGDRVVLPAGAACRKCLACQRGSTECDRPPLMAFDYDGAWAEYAVANAAGLALIPDSVSFEHAAIVADAVATPYGAVVNTGKVQIGESVGVWGIGGVGTHIIQIAKLVGAAPIIAIDTNPVARERALAVGADYAFDPRDGDLRAQIRAVTGGAGVDVSFDAVGITPTMEGALACTRSAGRLVLVGMSKDPVPLGPGGTFAFSKKQVLGHLGFRAEDTATILKLIDLGRLDLSSSISSIVSLEDVADGIRQLAEGAGSVVRVLVQP